MSTQLVWLAVLMAAATYPWRAVPLLVPAVHRLPRAAQEYLRLVGPAVLAALAAVNAMVAIDSTRHPSLHVGIEWPAIALCVLIVAARRGLLLGLVAAAGLAALARALGLA
ncbi:MAG: AzlD domain-containing protein [Chloroflexota bacterium]